MVRLPLLVAKEVPPVQDYAGWLASAATMIAAMMTAANLGARVTGWGFVVFTIGSLAWASVGFTSGQTSLLVTNAFLFLVNIFGVWRWLGRQARYEQGGAVAAERSRAHRRVPDLFSAGQLVGANVEDATGTVIGKVVDAMMACDTKRIGYVVISQGGVAGVGEVLRAVSPDVLTISEDAVRTTLSAEQLAQLAPIDEEAWPATLAVSTR